VSSDNQKALSTLADQAIALYEAIQTYAGKSQPVPEPFATIYTTLMRERFALERAATIPMNDIERARLGKIDDHAKISPVDLMRLLISDIEHGLGVDSIVILTKHINPDNGWVLDTRRANTPRDQELVLLEMGKDRCLRNWV
jgi:hypothetical protein